MKVDMSPEEAVSLRQAFFGEGRKAGYGEAARKSYAASRWAEPELAVLRLAVDAARREEPSKAWDDLALALAGPGHGDVVVSLSGADTFVRDTMRRCAEALAAEGRVLA